ncbi:Rho/RAC guanine nucleotide exchange factor [Entamoeba marina]
MDIVVAHCKGYLTRKIYNIRSCLLRKHVISEIFETELSFVSHLNIIASVFKQPIEDADGRIIPKLLTRTLFSNIDLVLTSACLNANVFQIACVEWKYDSCFGPKMLSTVKNMLPLAEYTLQWDHQQKALQMAYKNKLFKNFVTLQCSDPCIKGLSFQDLLIMPVQRLMRYHVLLSELLKHTPLKHPDYINTLKADQKFHDLVIATNTRAKQHDQLLTCASVISGMSELIHPWRYCLYYGECYVNCLKEKSMCFIFNDMITWMNTVVPIMTPSGANYYFNYNEDKVIPINTIKSHFVSEKFPNCYEIVFKTKHYIFIFPTNENLNTWVNVLKRCLIN